MSCFKNVLNVLKAGGSFLVCNDDSSIIGNEEKINILDMNIYTSDERKDFMANAGFAKVKAYCQKNRKWICIVGKKQR